MSPAPDIARLPAPDDRPRLWRVAFRERDEDGAWTKDLALAKLVSADDGWLKFRLADGRRAIFPTGAIRAAWELGDDDGKV